MVRTGDRIVARKRSNVARVDFLKLAASRPATKFPVGHLATVRVLRPRIPEDRRAQAWRIFLQAFQLSDDPKTAGRALRLYKSAIQLDPNLASAWGNLGNLYFRFCERPDEAEKCYRRAMQLDPEIPEIYLNLGVLVHQTHGDEKESERLIRIVLKLRPDLHEAQEYLVKELKRAP